MGFLSKGKWVVILVVHLQFDPVKICTHRWQGRARLWAR